jgi:predicted dehydrogenase
LRNLDKALTIFIKVHPPILGPFPESNDMVSRRSFLSRAMIVGGMASLPAISYRRVWGANERIGIGFIGYGLIGKRHVADFKREPDVDLAAVCDVYTPRRDEGLAVLGNGATAYADFRKLLDDPRVDAVVISTPDHWHAMMTMMACTAGKDVYVEKPLTLFQREGRWMIAVAERTGRIVQVGTQQRSGRHYQRARELILHGNLGRIVSARMSSVRNIGAGFGRPPDTDPPPDLDWNMWLGPAPDRPYNPLRALYHFRWFWDYSGGQMTNLGAHHLDIVDWVIGLNGLASVSCHGGRFVVDDGGETPDTQDAIFHGGSLIATWSMRECSRGEIPKYGLEFYGTHGSLGLSRSGFKITPDALVPAEALIPDFGGHPVGGPQRKTAAGIPQFRTTSVADASGDTDEQFRYHVRNFLDCVRSRQQPISDLESAHRTATVCHLANISMRIGRSIAWKPSEETVVNDPQASAQLVRPYRAPWDRELRALRVDS